LQRTKPDTVYTNTTWMFNMTATDPNNLTFTSYVQFYINDTPSGSVVSHSISNGTNINVANLSDSYFNKKPGLTHPDNNSYINSIMMNWTISTDADGDTVNYYVLVNGTQACYTNGLNCSYSPNNDGYYQWNVTPNDGEENGTISDLWYYTYDTTNPLLTH